MNTTLAAALWPETGAVRWLRWISLAVLGSVFVAVCARISIPMIPVPMTMQTFAVLTVGAAYGARLGAATLALYALEGILGLPVFAGGQAGLFRPEDGLIIATLGYVVGFIAAAGLTGWLAEKGWDRSIVTTFAAMLLGAIVLYVPGLAWLAGWFGILKEMDMGAALSAAFTWGLKPFVLADVVKAALAAAAFPAAWKLMARE